MEEAIVGWRKRLCEQGLDAGAATIAVHLAVEYERVPSTATIWRVLSRYGMVVAPPHKRPRSSYIRFQQRPVYPPKTPSKDWRTVTSGDHQPTAFMQVSGQS